MGTQKQIRIRQTGGLMSCNPRQRATVRGLGLRRRHHEVTVNDTPAIRGMLTKVGHLVTVVEEKGK